MKYNVRSIDYLNRAKRERGADDLIRLFYSAFELRAGVEARLNEYRDAIHNAKHDNTWQVRILKRHIENVVEKHEKPVTINFHDPDTNTTFPIRYVPITDELKSITERLGEYLHFIHPSKLQKREILSDLKIFVDKGIELLSDAVSGELLSPPLWDNKTLKGLFVFDQDKIPRFCKEGNSILFNAKFVVDSIGDSGITLKITSG